MGFNVSDSLKIKNIENYNEQIDSNKRKVINNIKLLVLFSTLIVFYIKEGLKNEVEEFVMAGSVLFGSINIMSLVKSICKNYELKGKINSLKDEYTKK